MIRYRAMKQIRIFFQVALCVMIFQCLTACTLPELPDIADKKNTGNVDQNVLHAVADSLSAELIGEGIDSVAVVDFTSPDGEVTSFEQMITERMFLSMAGFSGKIWVRRGNEMSAVLENVDSDAEVWRVMGIKAVVYGTVTPEDETIALSLRVMDAETSALISAREERCPMVIAKSAETEFSFIDQNAAPDLRSRNTESGEEQPIPAFPWPPALASASTKIPSAFFVNDDFSATLSQVAGTLENALENAGYIERSYYAVPDGFALVTRLEQVNPDGSPSPLPDRWAVQMTAPKVFSLASYLQALFTAQPGHFRIIAFLVTSAPFAQNPNMLVSREDAMEWLAVGSQTLPASIGSLPYSEWHYCVALVYEFEQPTRNHEASFKMLSAFSGIEHLKKAKIWEVLER